MPSCAIHLWRGRRVGEFTFVPRAPGTRYRGGDLVHLIGCDRTVLIEYCTHGLIEPADADGNEFLFDDEALFIGRRLHDLQQDHRLTLESLQLVAELLRRVSLLESELRFLREGQ
jgi:MerR HTH family regulatory protein